MYQNISQLSMPWIANGFPCCYYEISRALKTSVHVATAQHRSNFM